MCVFGTYRVARVVTEVDLGKSHVNHQHFQTHNAALIAVLVLGYNGHLGLSCTLRREDKILLPSGEAVMPAPLLSGLQTQHNVSNCLLTTPGMNCPKAAWPIQSWNLIRPAEETASFWIHER